MNNNHTTAHDSSRSPLLCRLARWCAEVLPGNPFARHIAACEDCRSHFEAVDEFENELRGSASRHSPVVPECLERRINHAVSDALRGPRPRTAWSSFAPWGIAVLSGAAAIALVAVFVSQSPGPAPSSPTFGSSPLVVAPNPEGNPPVTAGTDTSIISTITEQLIEQPYDREIEAVKADTRSALRFLALNFLPSVPAGLEEESG
jgi:hypothetical protein